MSISPYHDLETRKTHHRGHRAYWGGLGLILLGLLAIANHFARPAVAATGTASPSTESRTANPR